MFGQIIYKFIIDIDKDELLSIYSGYTKRVRVTTDRGLVLDLDADKLRKFTTNSGIRGYFQLTTTSDHKFVSLERIN